MAEMKVDEKTQLAIDCMTQHLKIYLKQSREKEKAEFGKYCGDDCKICEAGKCNFDWLENMKPILSQSKNSIR